MSSITEFFRMSKDLLCHEWLTNYDAKGAERSAKMWNTNFYRSFIKKKFVRERSAVKNSFSTYVCYTSHGLFWLNLYLISWTLPAILLSYNFYLSFEKLRLRFGPVCKFPSSFRNHYPSNFLCSSILLESFRQGIRKKAVNCCQSTRKKVLSIVVVVRIACCCYDVTYA